MNFTLSTSPTNSQPSETLFFYFFVLYFPHLQNTETLDFLMNDSAGKESACKAGDAGLIPGSGRSPGGVNGNLLQYSCLRNPMDYSPLDSSVRGIS